MDKSPVIVRGLKKNFGYEGSRLLSPDDQSYPRSRDIDDFTKRGGVVLFTARKAMAGEGRDTGGIDLTPAVMKLQTQNPDGEIKFHLDPAMLAQLQNAPGFVPVIISIQPMTDLKAFLGVGR